MEHLQKLWNWVLIKNPSGLACLVTAWGIGAVYATLSYTGLVAGLNAPLALRFCGAAGLALFVAVPILLRVFRS